MVEEYLAEVPPMGKIELEEHLASQSNVPPKIVPSGEASVDRIAKLLHQLFEFFFHALPLSLQRAPS